MYLLIFQQYFCLKKKTQSLTQSPRTSWSAGGLHDEWVLEFLPQKICSIDLFHAAVI